MKLTVDEFQSLMREKDKIINDLTQQLHAKNELIKQLQTRLAAVENVDDTNRLPLPLNYDLKQAETSREYVFFAWDVPHKQINAFMGKKLHTTEWYETKTTAKFDSSRVVAFCALG